MAEIDRTLTALADLVEAVKGADEIPDDLSLDWLYALSRDETKDAITARTCVLGACVDRRYPDAVCDHTLQDHRQEIARLRRVVVRLRATDVSHLIRRYRAMCKEYGRASATIAGLRGEVARLREDKRQMADQLKQARRSPIRSAPSNAGEDTPHA